MKIKGSDPSEVALRAARAIEAANAAETRAVDRSGGVKGAHAGSQSSPGSALSGSVQLSGQVSEAQAIVDIARAEPEFRQDLVDQARAELDAGALSVDADELARLIARDLFHEPTE